MRVAQQPVVLPALAPPRALFAFEQRVAPVLAVAADGLAPLVDCVRGLGAAGWRGGGLEEVGGGVVERDVEGYVAVAGGARGRDGGGAEDVGGLFDGPGFDAGVRVVVVVGQWGGVGGHGCGGVLR